MKKDKKIILLIFTLFCLLFITNLQAQNPNYNINGLKLPRLSTNDRDQIQTTNNPYAKGQLIYNTDIDCIEFWNGVNWQTLSPNNTTVSTPDSTTASNGLTEVGNDIQLGGNLSAATTINKNGKALTFSGAGTMEVSGSGETRITSSGNTTISSAGTKTISGTGKTIISTPLQFSNGTPGDGKILISDANGNASWQEPGSAFKSFYEINYQLNNVEGDWVNDFNTLIPIDNYTLIITGFKFIFNSADTGTNEHLLKSPVDKGSPVTNVYAFKSGGTWHISADFYDVAPWSGRNGSWQINCLAAKNTMVIPIGTISVQFNGTNSKAAGSNPIP
ncbi:MAG: hypothetical protein LBV69_06240 [Bacteroidales bacterium]|jgi:hypothetical protein|nr:hypothetical protein [Bacteroidales bacterium]